MKHKDPRIVNGRDSPRDVCQNTDNPIKRKTVPLMKRKMERNKLFNGSEGFCNGSGGFGSNRGTRDIILGVKKIFLKTQSPNTELI